MFPVPVGLLLDALLRSFCLVTHEPQLDLQARCCACAIAVCERWRPQRLL